MADTSDLLDTPMRADYQLPYQTSPPRQYRSATPMPVSSDSSTGSCSILTLSEILDKLERERPKAKAFREMGQRTRSAPPCDRATETPTKRRQPCDQRTRQPENMHRPVSEYSPGSTHESMKCGLDMEDDTSRPSTPLAEATATAARTVSQVAHDDDSEPRNVVHKHIPEVVNVSEDVASTQITDEAPAILGFLPPRLEKGKVVIFLPAPPDMFCPCCPQNYPPLLHSKGLGERVRRMENHVWDRHRRRSIIRCLGCGDDVNDRRHIKKCRFLKHKLTTFTNRPARWRYVAGPARDTNGRLMRPALEEHRVIIPIPANEVLVCPICDDRISSAIAEFSRRFSLKKHLCRAHGVEEVALICGGCDTEVRDWRAHKKECEKGRKIAPPPTPREMMPARCAYRDCELLFATAKQAALHFRVHATEQRRQRADANKFKPNTARARSERILEAIIGPKGMHQTNSENDINEGDNRSDCSRASGEEPPAPALDDKQKADQESTLQPQQNTQQQQGMDPTQGSTSADGHGHTLHHGLTKTKHQRGRRPEAGVRPPTSKASRTFFNSALSPEEVNRIQDQLTNKAPQRSNNRQVRTPLGSKEERRAQMAPAPTEQLKSGINNHRGEDAPIQIEARQVERNNKERRKVRGDNTRKPDTRASTVHSDPPAGPAAEAGVDLNRIAQQTPLQPHTMPSTTQEADPTSSSRTGEEARPEEPLRRPRGQRPKRTYEWTEGLQSSYEETVDANNSNDLYITEDRLEDLYNRLIAGLQETAKIKIPPGEAPKPTTTRNRQPPIADKHRIRKTYASQRRKAMRWIAGSDGEQCMLPIADIEKYFKDINDANNLPSSYDRNIYEEVTGREPVDYSNFSQKEVLLRLSKAENTAPGEDRITYNHLRQVDSEAKILTAIFNLIKRAGKIPDAWRRSRTILLFKGGDRTDLANWRPITLAPTIYKIYTGLWARRLGAWLEQNEVLSPAQKGFRPFDGVLEHNYALQRQIDRAKAGKRDLAIALLDLKNAFGSVPHGAIRDALKAAGAGEEFIRIAEDIYKNTFTVVLAAQGPTDPIPITRGIRQGCPLSGALFNLVIDASIRAAAAASTSPNPILAYADDIAIMTNSREELQQTVNAVQDKLKKTDIEVKPTKCAALAIVRRKRLDTELRIDGQRIKDLDIDESTKYLGCPVGFSVITDWTGLREQEIVAGQIADSCLYDWQKLDALCQFVLPTMIFPLRMGRYAKNKLNVMDTAIRANVKEFLSLPERASTSFIYGHREDGAIGMQCLSAEADFWAVDSAFKILTCRDTNTREAALQDAVEEAAYCLESEPGIPSLLRYLNNERTKRSYGPLTFWSRARQASKRLKIEWNFTAIGNTHTPDITLPHTFPLPAYERTKPPLGPTGRSIAEPRGATSSTPSPVGAVDPELIPTVGASAGGAAGVESHPRTFSTRSGCSSTAGDTGALRDSATSCGDAVTCRLGTNTEEGNGDENRVTLSAKDRSSLVRRLRDAFHRAHSQRWLEQPAQGIYASALKGLGKESTYFLQSGRNMKIPTYKFLFPARINSSPALNCCPGNVTKSCRMKCTWNNGQPASENIGHVTTGCRYLSPLWNARHNNIGAIYKEAAIAAGWQVLRENQAVVGSSRPDLVLARGRMALVVDFAVADAREGKLEKKLEEKRLKYEATRAHLITVGYHSAEVLPLVIGALGEWCAGSDAALKKVADGLKLKALREKIVTEAIDGSAACYYTHTGNIHLAPREYKQIARDRVRRGALLHPVPQEASCGTTTPTTTTPTTTTICNNTRRQAGVPA